MAALQPKYNQFFLLSLLNVYFCLYRISYIALWEKTPHAEYAGIGWSCSAVGYVPLPLRCVTVNCRRRKCVCDVAME